TLGIICFFLGYLIELDIDYNPNLNLSFWEILSNNLMVNFSAILTSIRSFGLYGILFVGSEMLSLGMIIRGIAIRKSFMYAMSFIFFHGILEVPSIVLSGAIGIHIWVGLICICKKKLSIKDFFKANFKLCILIMILTVVAAFVEANLTTWFLRKNILEGH
ncbi:stage II sporulation protein M, partial [Lachnotalea glycerini]